MVLGKKKSWSGGGEAIKPYQLTNISHISRTYSLATEAKRTLGIGELITKDKTHLVTETEGLQRQWSPRHEGGNPACMQLRVTVWYTITVGKITNASRRKTTNAPPKSYHNTSRLKTTRHGVKQIERKKSISSNTHKNIKPRINRYSQLKIQKCPQLY